MGFMPSAILSVSNIMYIIALVSLRLLTCRSYCILGLIMLTMNYDLLPPPLFLFHHDGFGGGCGSAKIWLLLTNDRNAASLIPGSPSAGVISYRL
jgi:hypothetical protein